MATAAHTPIRDEKRVEQRIPVSVPILLKFKNGSGRPIIEKTHTVIVNRAGARVLTQHPVDLGTRLEVAIPHLKRGSWATVVWLGEEKDGKRQVAIALDQTSDIWGMGFPDDTQQSGTRELDSSQEIAQVSVSEQTVSSIQSLPSALGTDTGSADILSNALRELARKAVEECLGNILQELKQQSDIMRRMLEDVAALTEERISRTTDVALEQLETRSVDVLARQRQTWEQSLHAIGATAEEQLKARATECDAGLASSAKNVRRELASTLAGICKSLAENDPTSRESI